MEQVDDSLELHGPGGWGAKVKGREVFLLILLLAVCAAGYAHHESTHSEIQQVKDKFEEMIFILAMPQSEREKLNLTMPDSLRQKVRRRRDE